MSELLDSTSGLLFLKESVSNKFPTALNLGGFDWSYNIPAFPPVPVCKDTPESLSWIAIDDTPVPDFNKAFPKNVILVVFKTVSSSIVTTDVGLAWRLIVFDVPFIDIFELEPCKIIFYEFDETI